VHADVSGPLHLRKWKSYEWARSSRALSDCFVITVSREEYKMKKALPFLLLLALALPALALQQKSVRSTDLDSMVGTERAFARAAATSGTRAAFLAFVADDGIVFAPGPVNGKKSWGERPARPGLLSWEPIYADISAAGDMGYDTGPWEFRPKGAGDKPVAFGQFMTIWKKQADGTFKFMLDLGISNPQPTSTQTLQFAAAESKATKNASEADIATVRNSILGIEREFSDASSEKGALKAYLSYMAEDVRLLHEGKFPFTGKQAARTALEAQPGKMSWQPGKSDVARSLDLGYSYGSYEWKSADGKSDESGYYVHIWKRQAGGEWKLVMEVLNPLPKKNA
jgi:ketosteroid isomerase-like protein